MAHLMKSKLEGNWKLKPLISSKKQIGCEKILFANNALYSNLKWEDIAGLF